MMIFYKEQYTGTGMTHSGIRRPIPVVTLAIMSMKTVP